MPWLWKFDKQTIGVNCTLDWTETVLSNFTGERIIYSLQFLTQKNRTSLRPVLLISTITCTILTSFVKFLYKRFTSAMSRKKSKISAFQKNVMFNSFQIFFEMYTCIIGLYISNVFDEFKNQWRSIIKKISPLETLIKYFENCTMLAVSFVQFFPELKET